jgi:hypothetical protein
MKHRLNKLTTALASGTLALCMLPCAGWSARLLATPIAGQITALPGGHEIEVANHTYHVKRGSPAEKTVVNLSIGQQVHLILDDAADPSKAEVVGISVDSPSDSQ